MANTVSNVTTGKPKVTGAIWTAPIGTTLPTDSTTALDVAFTCVGYISEDGLVEGTSRSSDKIKAWGGDPVLYTETEYEKTYKFTMLEATNVAVLKEVYGQSNVTGTLSGGIAISENAKELDARCYVIDEVLRDASTKRIVIPNGKITELDDITHKDDEAVAYGVTVSCLPDTSGNVSYQYIKAA